MRERADDPHHPHVHTLGTETCQKLSQARAAGILGFLGAVKPAFETCLEGLLCARRGGLIPCTQTACRG